MLAKGLLENKYQTMRTAAIKASHLTIWHPGFTLAVEEKIPYARPFKEQSLTLYKQVHEDWDTTESLRVRLCGYLKEVPTRTIITSAIQARKCLQQDDPFFDFSPRTPVGPLVQLIQAQEKIYTTTLNEVITAYIPFATEIARKRARRFRVEPDELGQVALEALIDAVPGYDVSSTVHFSAYTTRAITNCIKDHLRENRSIIRVPPFTQRQREQGANTEPIRKGKRIPVAFDPLNYDGAPILDLQSPISTRTIITHEETVAGSSDTFQDVLTKERRRKFAAVLQTLEQKMSPQERDIWGSLDGVNNIKVKDVAKKYNMSNFQVLSRRLESLWKLKYLLREKILCGEFDLDEFT